MTISCKMHSKEGGFAMSKLPIEVNKYRSERSV